MQPASSLLENQRLEDGSRVCETNMPLTHREYTDTLLSASYSNYESTSSCDHFFFFPKKKKKAAEDSAAADVMKQDINTY